MASIQGESTALAAGNVALNAFRAAAEAAMMVTIHAPFENFLQTWNYVPVTVWWKTFGSTILNSLGQAYETQPYPIDLLGRMLKGLGEASKDAGDILLKQLTLGQAVKTQAAATALLLSRSGS